jgi:hypothetical protein
VRSASCRRQGGGGRRRHRPPRHNLHGDSLYWRHPLSYIADDYARTACPHAASHCAVRRAVAVGRARCCRRRRSTRRRCCDRGRCCVCIAEILRSGVAADGTISCCETLSAGVQRRDSRNRRRATRTAPPPPLPSPSRAKQLYVHCCLLLSVSRVVAPLLAFSCDAVVLLSVARAGVWVCLLSSSARARAPTVRVTASVCDCGRREWSTRTHPLCCQHANDSTFSVCRFVLPRAALSLS